MMSFNIMVKIFVIDAEIFHRRRYICMFHIKVTLY